MIPIMQYLRTVLPGSGLSEGVRLVAFAIAAHADRYGSADPGIRALADLAGCHTNTVRRRIALLEAAGILAVVRLPGAANRYRFPVAAPLEIVHSRAHPDARTYPRVGARVSQKTARVLERADCARPGARKSDVVEAGDDGAARLTLDEARAIRDAAIAETRRVL